ncbi:MAG: SRPBCC family protein [Chloroflexia bacterium]
MRQPSSKGRSTRVSQTIKAPREIVYRAFLEPGAVASWLPPDGMRGLIDTFEPREGGKFRMSLTYLDRLNAPRGKTSEDTDTFEGRFVELLPNEKIVWVVEFESQEPDFAGEMRITWILADVEGGTEVTALCEDIPKGIRLEDNEMGSRQSLRKLASFIERGTNDPVPH